MLQHEAFPRKTLFICVPARLGSTRLPQKMLRLIGEQAMISHVCDRVLELLTVLRSEALFQDFRLEAFVLSDSREILDLAAAKGVGVMLSGRSHENGTSRIREFLEKQEFDAKSTYVLNIQGDEPFLSISDVFALLRGFAQRNKESFAVGTLVFRNTDFRQFLNPSCVKVAVGNLEQALYFSRSPVPWPRALLGTTSLAERPLHVPADLPSDWFFWHHVGIYVYRAEYLVTYNQEGSLDTIEGLEQLAVLACGRNIWVKEARHKSIGIDTEEDLCLAQALVACKQK